MNCDQLRLFVVRPALKRIELWSEFRENLMLGTCAQESAMGEYIVQLGGGPGRGIYQMEPPTQNDVMLNFLSRHSDLQNDIFGFCSDNDLSENEIIWNLAYATNMAFMSYYRHQSFIDLEENDVAGMAKYWKKYYNSSLGSGTEQEFIENYDKYVTPSSQ